MLHIDIYVLFAQLINFWILYFIFKKFVAQKLYASMNQRALQLEKLKKADEHYEEKMKLAEQERIEIIESARKTSRDLMKESEILAKAKAEAIMIQAHDGAMATLETGRRELEKERTTMLWTMKSHIVDISLKMNEKMFGERKINKEFIESRLEKIL